MEGDSAHQESIDKEAGYAHGGEAQEDNRPRLLVQQKGVQTAIIAPLKDPGLLRKTNYGGDMDCPHCEDRGVESMKPPSKWISARQQIVHGSEVHGNVQPYGQ